ncbi:aminoglycoside phosphotransferase family protein [Micromonospora sp. NPDC047707]|uniref:aminoglycoside phosphotransferase family protein n=1 Tax=Micromonospora sp. NPDC047707 TaxID=3154498 RepID=UPI0034558B07
MASQPPNPVKMPRDTPELRRVLETACAEVGLSPVGAELIHHYSNAVYLLPAERAVARLTMGAPDRVYRSQAVTRWLVEQAQVSATVPLPGVMPVVDAATTVSFWVHYPQPSSGRQFTSAHLARVVRQLHDVDEVPFSLERWEPLASLHGALREPGAAHNLSAEERAWLLDHLEDVGSQVRALDSPLGYGVIHGDAWAGNLLWDTAAGPDAVVLGDWDWVSYGPREIDLIPSWHAAIRYGRGQDWADAFAEVYGYDLARWDGFATLLHMRDLVQLTGPLRRAGDSPAFAEVLRERLAGVRSESSGAVWRALY